MHKDLLGKDVYENKIEAIKAVRNLLDKIEISIETVPDAPHKRTITSYLPLKIAKDITEAIMALGVFESQKDGRFIRPNVTVATPTYITNGDKQGYVTHYTLGGAIEAARNDRSIDKIKFVDCDGHEEMFYRNARTQTFELDVI